MALTPIDVQQKTFGTALRGYDLDEVDDFLDEVVTTLKSYEERLTEAQNRITALEADLAGKGDSESAISRALVAAQRSADMIVDEAKAESNRILEDAQAQNERLAAVRDEERAKLDVEVAGLRSGIAEIRGKVKLLVAAVEADVDAMDRVIDEGIQELKPDAEEIAVPPDAQLIEESIVVEEVVEATFDPASGSQSVFEVGDTEGTIVAEDVADDVAEETSEMVLLDAGDEADVEAEQGITAGADGIEADTLDEAIADATFKTWVPEAAEESDEVADGWAEAEDEAEDWAEEVLPADSMNSDDAETTDAWERAGFEGWSDDEAGDADSKPRRPWE